MSLFSRKPLTAAELYVRDAAQLGLRAEWLGQDFTTGRASRFTIAGLTADGRVRLTTSYGTPALGAPETVRAWMEA